MLTFQIYENLFKEGVLVAPKDFNLPQHPDITSVRNLEVIKAMQSLTSKGYVKTQFSWQYYYYSLTEEGLTYLREWLHLPAEMVPQTHTKPARPAGRPAGFGGARAGGDGAYRAPRAEGRDNYRRREDGEGKEGAGEFRPVSYPACERSITDSISASPVLAVVPPLLKRSASCNIESRDQASSLVFLDKKQCKSRDWFLSKLPSASGAY